MKLGSNFAARLVGRTTLTWLRTKANRFGIEDIFGTQSHQNCRPRTMGGLSTHHLASEEPWLNALCHPDSRVWLRKFGLVCGPNPQDRAYLPIPQSPHTSSRHNYLWVIFLPRKYECAAAIVSLVPPNDPGRSDWIAAKVMERTWWKGAQLMWNEMAAAFYWLMAIELNDHERCQLQPSSKSTEAV